MMGLAYLSSELSLIELFYELREEQTFCDLGKNEAAD
jgi:hypothetical protein